jgi:Tfp pilus assembly protein PilX
MINPIRNQKGIALVVTLMLLVLGFAVVATLLRLSTQETKLARLEQGYTTALDAAKAGTDLFIYQVEYSMGGTSNVGNPPTGFGTSFLNGACLTIKMSQPTSSWTSTSGWSGGCPTLAQATSPFPTGSTNTAGYYYDTTLPLGSYTVYVKVIDNYPSNATNITGSPCQYGCNYYTVLARAQAQGSSEHADIQFVYRFGS